MAKTRNKKSKGKELYIIVTVMILCLAIVISIPFISKQLNTFKYQGLTFTKERFDKLKIYHYYYYFNDTEGQNYQYNLYLKEDPRENNVPVSGEIIYPSKNAVVFVSVNGQDMSKCKNSLRDISTLGGFISSNLFKVKSAYPDKEYAKENNLTYVDCTTNKKNMVIIVKEGNETVIQRQEPNCYVINVANCNTLEAVEKFEVQSIIDAKKSSS